MRKISTILAMAATTATILIASPAQASQPYGGCKEAHLAPHSSGASWCRAHGWTVTRRLVVNRYHKVVFDRLPLCRQEDGSGQRSACTWNLHPSTPQGNGIGKGYWLDRRDRAHFVWNVKFCLAASTRPTSPGARQCIRNDWTIEVGSYPVGDTYAPYRLIISPNGTVYEDTLNELDLRPL